jgi:hypothetical protein
MIVHREIIHQVIMTIFVKLKNQLKNLLKNQLKKALNNQTKNLLKKLQLLLSLPLLHIPHRLCLKRMTNMDNSIFKLLPSYLKPDQKKHRRE